MSKVAGFLLLVLGAVTAYVGASEMYLTETKHLTHIAIYSTLGIGAALAVAGLAHFVAPHKAFLLSVPLLAYLQVQCAIDAVFFFEKPVWPAQLALLVASALILLLSYRGYKAKQAAAASAVMV